MKKLHSIVFSFLVIWFILLVVSNVVFGTYGAATKFTMNGIAFFCDFKFQDTYHMTLPTRMVLWDNGYVLLVAVLASLTLFFRLFLSKLLKFKLEWKFVIGFALFAFVTSLMSVELFQQVVLYLNIFGRGIPLGSLSFVVALVWWLYLMFDVLISIITFFYVGVPDDFISEMIVFIERIKNEKVEP